jgi:hypothetical protein
MWVNIVAGLCVIMMVYLMYTKIRQKFAKGLIKIPELSSFVDKRAKDISPTLQESVQTDQHPELETEKV